MWKSIISPAPRWIRGGSAEDLRRIPAEDTSWGAHGEENQKFTVRSCREARQADWLPASCGFPASQARAPQTETNNPRWIRGGHRGGYERQQMRFVPRGPFRTAGGMWGIILVFFALSSQRCVCLVFGVPSHPFACFGRVRRICRRGASILSSILLRINLRI